MHYQNYVQKYAQIETWNCQGAPYGCCSQKCWCDQIFTPDFAYVFQKNLKDSFDHDMAKALSDARAAWQKEDEETKQREIDHEVEVAVTNAVAEAKQQWTMTSNVSLGIQYYLNSKCFEVVVQIPYQPFPKNFLSQRM